MAKKKGKTIVPVAHPHPPSANIRCAENIALLSLLERVVPVLGLVENDPEKSHAPHVLPPDRERDLVSILAFLSSTKDDPNRVMAVCLEEDASAQSIKVLLAVNKSSPEDGRDVLRNVKEGFERILADLGRVFTGDMKSIEGRMFGDIVAFCRTRILHRMRSKKVVHRKDQSYLGTVFRRFIDCFRAREGHDPGFLDTAYGVLEVLDRFERETAQESDAVSLADVVTRLYRFLNEADLAAALETVENDIEPTLKKRILGSMVKIARYKEAAKFLCQTARRFPIMQNVEVIPLSLDASVFPRQPEGYEPSLQDTLARLLLRVSPAAIGGRLKIRPGALDSMFRERALKAFGEAKIHAEVQIVTHYELHPAQRPPRYIASNKDACYLCWTFIRAHGGFRIRKSHGVLYPGWKFPSLPQLGRSRDSMNEELTIQILRATNQLMAYGKVGYEYPNESTVFPIHLSQSTLSAGRSGTQEDEPSGSGEGADAAPVDAASTQELDPGAQGDLSEELADEARDSDSDSSIPEVAILEEDIGDSPGPLVVVPSESVATTGSHPPGDLHTCLVQGRRVSYNPRTLSTISFSTPLLTVFPEFVFGSTRPGDLEEGGENEWWIEWLGDQDAGEVRRVAQDQIIDAALVATDTEASFQRRGSIYLSHGVHIVYMSTLKARI